MKITNDPKLHFYEEPSKGRHADIITRGLILFSKTIEKNGFIKDLNINFYHCPWMRIEWGSNIRTPEEVVVVFVRMKKLYEG